MDYQNGIVSRYEDKFPGLLDQAEKVLAAAREASIPIIYVVVRFRESYPEISRHNKSFSRIRETGGMLE
jgi:nicotinamidase-related amidase